MNGMAWRSMRGLASLLLILLIFAMANTACANLVSLGYDDGQAEDGVWINDHRGHAVVFTAPCDNWTLSTIAINGMLVPNSTPEMFVIEVWDENLSLLSRTTDRPQSFFNDSLTWAEIDIPDITVPENFIVSFFESGGVFLGVDSTVPYGRSIVTARNPNRILPWEVQNHTWNESNWMIRAAGYSPEPTITITALSDMASQSIPAKIDAEAQDSDGNLRSAALYIIDNKTGEIVWSEIKDIIGANGKARFSWPGTMYQVISNGKAMGPIYAVNAPGIAEDISDLLAYSAPAVLVLEENRTGSVVAYFGDNGKLNAIIDSYGGVHYLSPDMMNITNPEIDYGQYSQDNISIKENSSAIGFLNVGIPSGPEDSGTTLVGPIVLSGSPRQNYGLALQKVKAGMGEYVAMVEVVDAAFNTVREVGETTIKVV
jgi:hypothetical protein